MEAPLNEYPERRHWRRFRSLAEHAIVQARVRPGLDAALLDISARGMHLETSHRLLPGTYVDVLLSGRTETTVVRGQVLRCAVVGLRSRGIAYRGAIAFEPTLLWLTEVRPERCNEEGAWVETPHTSR